jgi:copper(I)-binding protein
MPARGPASGKFKNFAIIVGAGMFFALSAAAPQAWAADSGLAISDTWIRVIVPSRPAAGYFKLTNNGDADQTLIGASSPGCGTVMLHKSVTVDGADKMEMVMKVPVPAHGALEFAPHGYHLMCMKPSADMKPGADMPVTLNFESGISLTADFKIKGATGE